MSENEAKLRTIEEAGSIGIPRIRGHHLNNLRVLYDLANLYGQRLAYEGYPKALTVEVDGVLRKWANDLTIGVKDPFTFSQSQRHLWEEYCQDVLGIIDEDENRHSQLSYEAGLKIITPSSENLVFITETPDLMCSACKIGSHCLKRGALTGYPYFDDSYITIYIDRIQAIGGRAEIFYENFKFSNRDTEEVVKTALTTFGDLRTYLDESLYSKRLKMEKAKREKVQ
jgi:hypothetical protein